MPSRRAAPDPCRVTRHGDDATRILNMAGTEIIVSMATAPRVTPNACHWSQEVPQTKAGKNRLHLDLYPTGRDGALPMERRVEIVEAEVAALAGLGASVERHTQHDDPDDPVYYVVMHDPEGNEFCVS
jgi:Glyoxalase-like domain